MEELEVYTSQTQQFLAPLRDSIIDKPLYTAGRLLFPEACFSLFYKVTKDGHDARCDMEDHGLLRGPKYFDAIGLDTSTLQMSLLTSWNNLLRLVNQLHLAGTKRMCWTRLTAKPER